MLGIAAGRPGETSIGDIIVPRLVWDYGAGKWEERKHKVVFLPRPEQRVLDAAIHEWCFRLKSDEARWNTVHRDWMRRNPKQIFKPPKVHIEPLVSGAAVINAKKIWSDVSRQHEKVFALDMEAYAVASAVHTAAVPGSYDPSWLIAKSVCDFGMKKKSNAQNYAAYTSVSFFKAYLHEIILKTDFIRRPARDYIPTEY
jgi:nucleoside phosphorylase